MEVIFHNFSITGAKNVIYFCYIEVLLYAVVVHTPVFLHSAQKNKM